ncbi:VOC family protein [Gottfriedia sp. NPDC056225]|uniref:VOC family protein n=1 Tax=Gottfriedia sp. NPDC056225 TaxID=3345751 RepID=UPI00155985C0|nr:VOC family protein [Arthrobacter citreus]
MTMKITPCIVMSGNAKEAVHFYESELEAKILSIQTYGEMPFPCSEALKSRISNAILKIGESELILFDAPTQTNPDVSSEEVEFVQPAQNKKVEVTINLSVDNVEKTRSIFNSLRQGGQIIAPLEEVPFSPAFGTVTDQFGVTFILITQQ